MAKENAFLNKALRYQVKKPFTNVIGAYDIETEGLYGDYLDGFLKYEDDATYYRACTMAEMLDLILKRPDVILYAHNFKGYEANYLVDELKNRSLDIDVVMQGDTGVIGLIINLEEGHRIELRDSLVLIPMPLKKAAIAYGVLQKTDIGLSTGIIYDPSNPIHQEYCKNDVAVTIELVKAEIAMTQEVFGCGIGYTASSTALACWKTTIPKKHSYWRTQNKAHEQFCRAGYYGGFVYPGKDIHPHDDVVSIDRNAAYAAAMKCGVPVGKPRYTTVYEEGVPGMYEVFVKADSPTLPCIPYKQKNILMWPRGKFKTIITSVEIDFARQHGYDITIEEGLVWDTYEYPFNHFLDLCEYTETHIPAKKPSVKIKRNGLYGKFGSKFVVKEVKVCDDPPSEEWIPYVDENTGDIYFNLWTQEVPNVAPYIQPHWAAFITAHERVWMFETMAMVGIDHVRYGDTDSVKADGFRVRELIEQGKIIISDKYGDCKVDEEYAWFQCLGPKVYHGVLKNGDTKLRAKGIPGKYLTTSLFQHAYEGIFPKVSFDSSNGTLSRMKRQSLPLYREIHRSLTNFRTSQTWDVLSDGSIAQPKIEE